MHVLRDQLCYRTKCQNRKTFFAEIRPASNNVTILTINNIMNDFTVAFYRSLRFQTFAACAFEEKVTNKALP